MTKKNHILPWSAKAKIVCDVAAALGQRSEQSFFRMQAQVQMEFAFKALHCAELPVTLETTYDFLSSDSLLREIMAMVATKDTREARLAVDHFQGNFLTQPAEQLGGVKTTIANYLKHFTEPDIADIFCPKESTFSFDDIDRGKIICVSIPQRFPVEPMRELPARSPVPLACFPSGSFAARWDGARDRRSFSGWVASRGICSVSAGAGSSPVKSAPARPWPRSTRCFGRSRKTVPGGAASASMIRGSIGKRSHRCSGISGAQPISSSCKCGPKTPEPIGSRRTGSISWTTLTCRGRPRRRLFVTWPPRSGKWVPYFALCLFAGIRPAVPHGEITKLKPEAVDLDAGVIRISAEVSKVREPRNVEIQPNLAAWLRAYPLEKFPIVLGNFKKRRQKFAKKFNLTHDVRRHTFISMFVAKFRPLDEAAIQAGNSEAIIRKHYLDLKSAAEAEQFFGILPQKGEGNAEVGVTVPMPPPVTGAPALAIAV